MSEPSPLHYILLVLFCLVCAVFGLYFLANFRSFLRGKIKNELLRKNVVAWLIIFLLSSATTPISGGLYYMVANYGWLGTLGLHAVVSTFYSIIVFNSVNAVAENRKLKTLSFVKHKLIILVILIITSLAVNIPTSYFLYGYEKEYMKYMKYGAISNIYLTATIGLVYAVLNYLDLKQKRKFDEKELELSRLRESKAKAELDALHSKVNPHFLYNALNSIADLAVSDGKKARKMTIALADLFRYSINYSQNNFSTVNEEVAMTEVYLQIEKIRFEDQLTYTVRADKDIGHYLVPRFILQPLVENAVKHGLKATGRMTEIILEIKAEETGLILNIADNGPPFPDELVPGYGVKSVFDKMELLFPGQFEIHFTNQPRKQVSIHIHKLIKNEPGV